MPLVLVTGSTDGIGRQTALDLLRRGADVLLHGRNPARLDDARRELERAAGRPVAGTFAADLASLDDVRRLGAEVRARHERLDVLLNNAGVYMNERLLTRDGFEMTFGVNHLAPFLLTHELLGALESSGAGRVVNVSSVAHTRARIDWPLDDLQLARRFDPYNAYAQSKLANVLFTVELARRLGALGKQSVTVNALHPGVVSTKLLTEGFGMQGGDSLERGAATSVYLALAPDVAGRSGGYWANSRPAHANPLADDAEATRRFYDESARLVGITGLPPA